MCIAALVVLPLLKYYVPTFSSKVSLRHCHMMWLWLCEALWGSVLFSFGTSVNYSAASCWWFTCCRWRKSKRSPTKPCSWQPPKSRYKSWFVSQWNSVITSESIPTRTFLKAIQAISFLISQYCLQLTRWRLTCSRNQLASCDFHH